MRPQTVSPRLRCVAQAAQSGMLKIVSILVRRPSAMVRKHNYPQQNRPAPSVGLAEWLDQQAGEHFSLPGGPDDTFRAYSQTAIRRNPQLAVEVAFAASAELARMLPLKGHISDKAAPGAVLDCEPFARDWGAFVRPSAEASAATRAPGPSSATPSRSASALTAAFWCPKRSGWTSRPRAVDHAAAVAGAADVVAVAVRVGPRERRPVVRCSVARRRDVLDGAARQGDPGLARYVRPDPA